MTAERLASDWSRRDPAFQVFSDWYLRQLAAGADKRTARAARAELAFRAWRADR